MARRTFAAALSIACTWSATAAAHHEALFGPQSSLAVESTGFVSLQMHTHVIGTGASLNQASTYIVSGGVSPIHAVPWSLAIVQPVTLETARSPTGNQTGAFSSCGGCIAFENVLLSTSYRFDFTGLQRVTGKDGNFILLSASLEPPTGNKDYAPLHGPTNYLFAAMAGLEWRALSAVALGYYRVNAIDDVASKKGNNWLAGLGFAFNPIDERARLFSIQLAIAIEAHDPDVSASKSIDASGGWEAFASPTVVWSPAAHWRFFTYVSIPFVQDYRTPEQEDRWRAGLGLIYSFSGGEPK